MKSLDEKQTDIFNLYKKIREENNEEYLIEQFKNKQLSITDKNKEGMTPLIFAVDCEFSNETLKTLLDLGCSVFEMDDTGRNPLHYAVDLENERIIRFLLENGSDPYVADDNG
jgi:ankyrin repeat protein